MIDVLATLDFRFGGDKDQVTIDGESAGGASVVMQMVAYGGEKGAPFKRVVSQSIGYDPLIDPLSSRAETLFGTSLPSDKKMGSQLVLLANFSIAVGCSNGTSNSSALACLRNASLGMHLYVGDSQCASISSFSSKNPLSQE